MSFRFKIIFWHITNELTIDDDILFHYQVMPQD